MTGVTVVGSGASAVAAIMELVARGVRPVVLDVGFRPSANSAPRGHGNLYDFKAANDSYALTIGERQQGLFNLLNARRVPVKLTTPNTEYVTALPASLPALEERGFCAIQSFAMGGLANAWGAGLYRFTDRDLDGFPITAASLVPYFDHLTRAIGISGIDDDLSPFFGSTEGLLPPIELGRNIGYVYRVYMRKRNALPPAIRIGRARVAALTVPHDGRPAISYDNFEFWQDHPGLYSPRYTLERLIADNKVDYRPGHLVTRFIEDEDGVSIVATDLTGESETTLRTRYALLAAGAINTARIVLQSNDDYETRLPLLENPAIQVPFVLPAMMGEPLQTRAFGLVQLNLVWESETFGALCQASIMEITSPLRAEFFAGLPYSARANLALIRHLLPTMIVLQLFLPESPESSSRISLGPERQLRITGGIDAADPRKTGPLLSFMRRLGAWTLPHLQVRVPTGHGIHYAGTLPMSPNPGRYQCTRDGLLSTTRRVYVGDSATFPRLPAKNMSFGMMANAMRIATHVAARAGEAA